MKYPILFAFLLALCPSGLFANLISLTNTEGRAISVTIDNYNAKYHAVGVRINGEGSVIPIKMDQLDEDSQNKVMEWKKLNDILKFLTIRCERVTSGKGERVFNIELMSQSKVAIEGLRIEYSMPIKKTHMEKEVDTSSKKKTVKYQKVTTEEVINGSIDVAIIKPHSTEHIKTETVSITTEQTLDQGKDKDPKEITNDHSLKGVLLKIYIGDELVREYESQNGIKQLISKYKRSSRN